MVYLFYMFNLKEGCTQEDLVSVLKEIEMLPEVQVVKGFAHDIKGTVSPKFTVVVLGETQDALDKVVDYINKQYKSHMTDVTVCPVAENIY